MPQSTREAPIRWLQLAGQAAVLLTLAAAVGLGVNWLRPAKLPWISDWSVKAQLAAQSPSKESLVLPLKEAEALLFSGEGVFIDARSPALYRQGHIEGARSLPWEEFEQYFPNTLADVPKDARIVVYCDGETCGLSKELALTLVGKGYTHVRVLLDGWTAWQQANLPVESDESAN